MFRHARIALAALAMLSAEAKAERVPLETHCADHPGQMAFLEDDSKEKVLLTSRRYGKTEVLMVALALAVEDQPGSYGLYITKTRKNAKLYAWKILKRILTDTGRRYKANESDLTLELEGGGLIVMGGADKISEIEKYRGFPFTLAIVDECGVYPSDLLQSLREDVLEPTTVDFDGAMIFAGTPGPTLEGVWFELSGPTVPTYDARTGRAGVHRGTLLENPFLMRHLPIEERRAAIEGWLAAKREKHGWTELSPTYIREYLGRWVQDDSVLVFPFSAERNGYEPSANGPHGLPAHTPTGVLLTVTDWLVVLAVDVGVVDAMGYAVVATHPALRESYVLSVHKRRGQLIDSAAQEVRLLLDMFAVGGRAPILVVDAGGMGKVHAETFGQKYGLAVVPAEKTEKTSSIMMTRDDVQSSRIKVFAGECCDAIRAEWAVLGWNDKRDGIADGQEDHGTDGVLYGMRYLRNYTQKVPGREPEEGTPEWYAREARRMEEALERQARAEGRKSRRRRGKRVA